MFQKKGPYLYKLRKYASAWKDGCVATEVRKEHVERLFEQIKLTCGYDDSFIDGMAKKAEKTMLLWIKKHITWKTRFIDDIQPVSRRNKRRRIDYELNYNSEDVVDDIVTMDDMDFL